MNLSDFSRTRCRVPIPARTILLVLTLLAFALRVFQLGVQAIWWDESLSLYRATRDLPTILANTILIQNVPTIDLQPPLYFIVLHFLVGALGTTEFALRFLTVFANVATIPLLYALGARWLDARAGLLAATLGALSPFYIAYAQEARPYAVVLFWSLLAIYALTRAFGMGRRQTAALSEAKGQTNADGSVSLRGAGLATKQSPSSNLETPALACGASVALLASVARNDTREFRIWLFTFILSAAAALYSHYYAIFLFPFYVLLITLYVWDTPRARAWILLPALPLSSIIFLLPIIQRGAAGNVLSGPSVVPLTTILFDLLNSFSVGVSADANQTLFFDFALFVFFALGIAAAPQRTALILFAFLCVPLAALQVATLYRPLYQNSRYFIAISPAFYLGVAAGIAALARRWRYAAWLALAIFVAGAVLSLNNLYFNPRYGKDDHRAWAEFLRERVRPDDFLILNSPHTEMLFNYYARDIVPYATLPLLRPDGLPSLDADNAAVIRAALAKNPRVWYLSMHTPFDDSEGRVERMLNDAGVLLDRAEFPGVSTAIALSQYVTALPVLQNRAAIPHPTDLSFGALRLLGWDAPAQIESGARVVVKLYWQVDEPVGEDYAVSLRLVDDASARVAQWDAVPLGNRAGTSTWQTKTIIVAAHDLPVPIGAARGNYRLQVVPYHSATGAPLGEVVTLGEIQVR